jgi:hypothetical protein
MRTTACEMGGSYKCVYEQMSFVMQVKLSGLWIISGKYEVLEKEKRHPIFLLEL